MRRVLSALTGISLLLASSASFGQQSANSNVAEFNGANVTQKFPPPVEAADGMAVSSQRDASKAGAEILAAGGNAVDAAVAVGYALAVVHPCCGNIGGGGFATIHLANGKNTFINFREKAPAAASANMYLDADGNVIPDLSIHGYKAIGVPGTVMGMERMLKEYGTMTRAQVMAPAIKLADEVICCRTATRAAMHSPPRRLLLSPMSRPSSSTMASNGKRANVFHRSSLPPP